MASALTMRLGSAVVEVDLDFLQTGPQRWDIVVDTADGTLTLSMGGSVLSLPGQPPVTYHDRDYARLYAC